MADVVPISVSWQYTGEVIRERNRLNVGPTVCNKRFTQSGNLVRHSRIHSGQKPYQCCVCDRAFSRSRDLSTHVRVHPGEKPYKCHVCDKAFSQCGGLNTHMRVHTGEKPHKCSECDRSFSDFSSLYRHKRCVHSNSKRLECPHCGKLFKIKQKRFCTALELSPYCAKYRLVAGPAEGVPLAGFKGAYF